jgi:hypothetical protein
MKKIAAAVSVMMLAFACGGTPKKAVDKAEDVAADSCCCKWTPAISDDAKAKYANGNRMECSGKQGECVAETQCNSGDGSTPAP